jgi:hypothetical protein
MSGITLVEASKLIHTPLKKGIIETIVRESAVLETLPFVDVNGASYGFIREESDGGATFRAVSEDYLVQNPTYSNNVESLKRLGSKVEVDRFVELTGNLHDARAEATSSKAKAIANYFTQTFFHGDSATETQAFDGLNKRIEVGQIVDAQGFDFHTGLMHQLMDMVQGNVDVIYMNKRTRRALTSLFMAQRAFIQAGQDAFGRPVQIFSNVRVAVVEDMYLPDNSIFAMAFGADEGVTGIQNGELQAEDNGLRGTMYETLIEWYCSIIVSNPKGVAKLTGFTL